MAGWLLDLPAPAPAPDRKVVLRQRKRVLASQLGATPETFSRVLRHWSEQGLVLVRGYTIHLIDEARLRELSRARK